MTEENERLDPEEIGELASTPFKTEIQRKVVTDSDGNVLEIVVETRKTMTPSGEIISDKREMVSTFVSCGHQVTDVRQIIRCDYRDRDQDQDHFVCRDCITRCDGCKGFFCIYHSDDYEYEQGILNLCLRCAEDFEYEMRKENTPTKKALRFFKGIILKEEHR